MRLNAWCISIPVDPLRSHHFSGESGDVELKFVIMTLKEEKEKEVPSKYSNDDVVYFVHKAFPLSGDRVVRVVSDFYRNLMRFDWLCCSDKGSGSGDAVPWRVQYMPLAHFMRDPHARRRY